MSTKLPMPAKGKSTRKTEPSVPPATPEMIQAAFAILHQEGWRPPHKSAFHAPIPDPIAGEKVKAPTRAQLDAASEYARQMGWTPLSPSSANLVRTVHRMNYRGRAIVLDVANALQRVHPWIDGDPRNTEE